MQLKAIIGGISSYVRNICPFHPDYDRVFGAIPKISFPLNDQILSTFLLKHIYYLLILSLPFVCQIGREAVTSK